MYKFILTVSLLFAYSLNAADFAGWEGLRVIAHEGSASGFTVIKSKVKGRQLLCSVNRRQSRIDIYSWLDKKDRKAPEQSDRPNELPFPADFKRDEIILERFPLSIQAADVVGGDNYPELYIITSNPMTLNRFEFKENKWSKTQSWRLIQEKISYLQMLINDGKAYMSSEKGIMVQELKVNSKAHWLLPVEKGVQRLKWWFADINKDGSKDLLELKSDTKGGIEFNWKENLNGRLLPAVPLGKITASSADLDMSDDNLTFYLLNSVKRDTVSTYKLEQGEESAFGKNRIQPLLSMNPFMRTSLVIDGKKVLVEIDPVRPQMRVSELSDRGFSEIGSFPVLRNVKAVTAVAGKGILLYQINNSADLYISTWKNGRFSFPKIYQNGNSKGTRKILGLNRHGQTVWWTQTVDKDLYLYKWDKGAEKAVQTVFKGIGYGLDRALWLGEGRMMVRKKYAKSATFYDLKEGKPQQMAADHLKDALENQFHIFRMEKLFITARIVDGVIQWLDDSLQPIDQVMLNNGRMITDCVLRQDGSMLVLESSGKTVSLLEKDKSGVMREKQEYEILSSQSVSLDPVLGLTLANKVYLNNPLKGRAWELKLLHTVDAKLGLPTGEKQAKINRFILSDVTGSAKKELLNVDYARRQLTLIDMAKKPTSIVSWKVYDDGKYPYSDGRQEYAGAGYPYILEALDFDGDGIKELVMPCHDRLLIYIGREN